MSPNWKIVGRTQSEFRKARHTQIIQNMEDVMRMWDFEGFEWENKMV